MYGIIGCGKQAPKHISGLHAAGVTQIGIVDAYHDKALELAKTYPSLTTFDNIDALYDHPDLQGVLICTPTTSHASLISRAIDRKVAWLCEKPLCDSLTEAEVLLERTRAADVFGMVGWIYRASPAMQLLRQVLPDEGTSGLGQVLRARFRLGGRGGQALWKHKAATGGGAINEMMVHMLDLLVWLFGTPQEVALQHKSILMPDRMIDGEMHRIDAEDWVVATFTMPSGAVIEVQADFISRAFTQYVEVLGTKGYFRGSIQPDQPTFIQLDEPYGEFKGGVHQLKDGFVNMYEAQTRNFLESAEGHREKDLSSVISSVEVMRLVEYMRRMPFN